ncbi:hypothetical protein FHW69_000895 [Luteibacter sp. Sphag1AF]|uniref:hypothetical protein n=1 Tax=Luteibacter sp. Sphag1AF TaxID=2587031 RepID=UPI001612F68F|nr:hypothetical protein [Luteibacter sp. Sphag1AF]MBB3226305.1 hypothetical protein [Luteibacter sp. Sphag1AF]
MKKKWTSIWVSLALAASSGAYAQAAKRPYIHDMNQPFDKYTWVTTHNSYNTWFSPLPSQLLGVRAQLDSGVRGLGFDIHEVGGRVYACHGSCLAGGKPLSEYFNESVMPFLTKEPYAVLTIFLEDYVSRTALQRELSRIPGLGRITFKPNTWNTTTWPTLRQMVDANQRIVFFDVQKPENAGDYSLPDGTATILAGNAGTTENHWEMGKTIFEHDWSCKRRWSGIPLAPSPVAFAGKTWTRPFVMNHFHGGAESSHSGYDNRYDVLGARVDGTCKAEAKRAPNYLVIDHFEKGDAFELAGVLMQGGIVLYEGNNASQNVVCGIPGRMAANFSFNQSDRRGCENDEARSATIENVPAGTIFQLYDSPSASGNDDYFSVKVVRDLTGRKVTIPSFERSYMNEDVVVLAGRRNGLDGKVSYARVIVPTTAKHAGTPPP